MANGFNPPGVAQPIGLRSHVASLIRPDHLLDIAAIAVIL